MRTSDYTTIEIKKTQKKKLLKRAKLSKRSGTAELEVILIEVLGK